MLHSPHYTRKTNQIILNLTKESIAYYRSITAYCTKKKLQIILKIYTKNFKSTSLYMENLNTYCYFLIWTSSLECERSIWDTEYVGNARK